MFHVHEQNVKVIKRREKKTTQTHTQKGIKYCFFLSARDTL